MRNVPVIMIDPKSQLSPVKEVTDINGTKHMIVGHKGSNRVYIQAPERNLYYSFSTISELALFLQSKSKEGFVTTLIQPDSKQALLSFCTPN